MPGFPIFIEGTPIPQGSKSISRSGHMYESNPRHKAWRDTMQTELKTWVESYGDTWEPLDGPLEASVTFWMPKPLRPKFGHPAVKPDADKLQRALGDALTATNVIVDDARIVTWHARKRYSLIAPGVEIHHIQSTTDPETTP